MSIDVVFDRRIPLAIVGALMLQAGGAVWWAASKESDDRFQRQRIDHLEQVTSDSRDAEIQILERLARIEERVSAEGAVLDRIEKQVGALRR